MSRWKTSYNDARHYKKEWEEQFKWLSWIDNACYCRWCKCSLSNMRKSAFELHEKTVKHKKAVEASSSSRKITETFKKSTTNASKELKEFEIKFSVSAACHCSVRSVDHQTELIAQYGKGSILENLKLHRTKCMSLIKNVISLALFEDLLDDIRGAKYSLLIDESTDVSVTKHLCICVRYFSQKEQTVTTAYLGIIPVVSTTGESLFDAISNFLQVNNIDIHDCIGLGTDGANNVSGEFNSVFSRFREMNPDIQFIKCTCHSLALCAEKAFSSLPGCLEYLISAIPRWFSVSSLRREDYKQIYATMNDGNENHEKFVSPSTTRWLVRGKCMYSILIQWEELKAYFSSIVDKSFDARMLKDMILDESNKLYLTFACPIIQNFEALNAAFQASNPDPTKLFQELDELRNFLLKKIYRNFSQRQLPWLLSDGKLGDKFELDLKVCNLSADKKKAIQMRCHDFIVEAVKQIDKRIDKTTMKLNYIKYLSPQKCLSQVRPKFTDLPLEKLARAEKFDIHKVANQYERIAVKTDWGTEFPNSEIPAEPVAFWSKVLNFENAVGEKCYQELATIALNSYCIPLSTAFVERVFSHVTNIKTKARNKLCTSSLDSILRIRTHLHNKDICCRNFKVTEKMLALFTSQMYRGTADMNIPGGTGEADQQAASTSAASEGDSFEEILAIEY